MPARSADVKNTAMAESRHHVRRHSGCQRPVCRSGFRLPARDP
jgi:hypothetical protein